MSSTSVEGEVGAAEYHDVQHDTTVEELEIKLKELELRFLGKELPVGVLSPFTPVSSLKKRIEQFRHSLQSSSAEREGVQTKLPPLPLPTFDGSDLDSFLNEFERWLRLSGVDRCSELPMQPRQGASD